MMKRPLIALIAVGAMAWGCSSDGEAPTDSQSQLFKACAADCTAIAAPQCQVSSCDTTTGECVFAPLDKTACDDAQFCTVNDTCQAGVCAGEANDCGLGALTCKTAACSETTHSCHYEAQADGFSCDAKDVCASGASCQSGSCVPVPRTCHFEPVPDDCHVAQCNAATGACDVFVPGNEGLPCSSDSCVSNGICQNGVCHGDARDCTGWGDGCNTASCDAAHEGCFKIPKNAGVVCSKTDTCNAGACNATGACILTPRNEGKACKDALTCSTGDTCQSGACGGTPPATTKVYFQDAFSGNSQGWTLDGSWGIAPTAAVNSFPYSNCKPDVDHTNSMDHGIATTNIAGHDGETPHDFQYLTSRAVDTSSATSLVLVFSVISGMPLPPYAHGVAEVFDGTSWITVWENAATQDACIDPDTFLSVWKTVTIDVAAHKNAAMRVRFGTKYVLASPSPGLSVDDVALVSAACP